MRRSYRVPQVSILGPGLLNPGYIIREYWIDFHSYADDTQQYASLSPNDSSASDTLLSCIDHIKLWMSHNFLQLNKGKTFIALIKDQR